MTDHRPPTTDHRLWAALLLILGAALRLRVYFANRSLWLDESKLALNIMERLFRRLFEPMNQSAPPGFLVTVKALTVLFGTSEYVLRLLPLLSALAALVLFYCLVRKFLEPRAALIALFFFAISEHLIYYAAEVKQYSTDTALTLTVVLAAWRVAENPNQRGLAKLSLLGAIALWFSNPCIFVLALAGLWLLVLEFKARRVEFLPRLAVMGVAWAISFYIQYALVIKGNPLVGFMMAIWHQSFAPLNVSGEALMWYYQFAVTRPFFYPVGLSLDYAPLAALAFAAGCVSMHRRNPRLLALLALPVLLALLASSQKIYPFSGKFLLFAVPMFILFLAEGIGLLWSWRRWSGLLAIPLLACLAYQPALAAADRFLNPPGKREVREVLRYVLAHRRPEDKMYVFFGANSTVRYYMIRWSVEYQNPDKDKKVVRGNVKEGHKLALHDRVWVIYAYPPASNYFREQGGLEEDWSYLDQLTEYGQKLETYKQTGASATLIEITSEPPTKVEAK